MAKTYLKDLAKKTDLEGLAQQSELADYAKTADVDDEYLKKSGGILTGTLKSGGDAGEVRIAPLEDSSVLEIVNRNVGTNAFFDIPNGGLQIAVSNKTAEELYSGQASGDIEAVSFNIPQNESPNIFYVGNGRTVVRQIPTSNNAIYFNVTADGILEVTYGEDASLSGGER